MLAMGVVLFILFSVFVVLYNVENVTKALPQKLTIMVFLNESIEKEKVKDIEKAIMSQRIVKTVDFVPRELAMEELKKLFKSDDYMLKGFGENPLFDTFNVKIKENGVTVNDVNEFIKVVSAIDGVDNVESGGEFLKTVYLLKNGLRVLAVTVGLVFTFAVVFICYTTVSILFYRYKEEIDIYKLLGATKGFIRVPFFLEGSIIGFFGGIIGAIILYLIYVYVIKIVLKDVPILSLLIVPTDMYVFLPLMGCFVGFIGSVIALGRLKY